MEKGFATVKFVLGVFFTALGLLMTLDNLRVVDGGRLILWWPLVFIAIGLVKLNNPASRVPAVASLVGGSVLLTLNTTPLDLADLWPLLLIGLGIFVVVQSSAPPATAANHWLSVLTARQIVVTDRAFAGGNAIALLGGCELDLRNAGADHGPVVINALAIMGGIGIRVPDGWQVVSDVVPFMGGVEVKTGPQRDAQRQLRIRGFVMMGGLEVKP